MPDAFAPALTIGSRLGVQAICACNWRSPILDSDTEPFVLYHEHVRTEHSDSATHDGKPYHFDDAGAPSQGV